MFWLGVSLLSIDVAQILRWTIVTLIPLILYLVCHDVPLCVLARLLCCNMYVLQLLMSVFPLKVWSFVPVVLYTILLSEMVMEELLGYIQCSQKMKAALAQQGYVCFVWCLVIAYQNHILHRIYYVAWTCICIFHKTITLAIINYKS